MSQTLDLIEVRCQIRGLHSLFIVSNNVIDVVVPYTISTQRDSHHKLQFHIQFRKKYFLAFINFAQRMVTLLIAMDYRKRKQSQTLVGIPLNVLVQILTRCDGPTLAACAASCKALYDICHARGRCNSLIASSSRAARSRKPRQTNTTMDLANFDPPYGASALLQLLQSNPALRDLRLAVQLYILNLWILSMECTRFF